MSDEITTYSEKFRGLKFQEILASKNPAERLREVIHQNPLAVFWVSPTNSVVDAKSAHNENPPNGDRSVLADSYYKGYLRGRAAYIDNIVYVVFYYWPKDSKLTKNWEKRVKSAEKPVLDYLADKRHPDNGIRFVGENGHTVI